MNPYAEEHKIKDLSKVSPCPICKKKDLKCLMWFDDSSWGMGEDRDHYGRLECANCGNAVEASVYDYDGGKPWMLEDALAHKWNVRAGKRVD